MRDCYRMSGRF